jgi:hypothetical protein
MGDVSAQSYPLFGTSTARAKKDELLEGSPSFFLYYRVKLAARGKAGLNRRAFSPPSHTYH